MRAFRNATDSVKQTEAYRNALYSSTSADTATFKNVLKYRYRHVAKVDIESKAGKFSFGISGIYNSFMENIDALFETTLLTNTNGKGIGLKDWRQEHNNGDLILDVRAAYQITDIIKASFLVNNLMNREYSSRPGKLDSPRHFTLRLDFKF